jgi:TatD DNase family protein
MLITDTHTHLYSDEFEQDRSEMIQRAIDAGVSRFFIPAIDSFTQSMYELERNFPENMFLMMGLHPTHVKDNYLEELHVEEELAKRKFMPLEK